MNAPRKAAESSARALQSARVHLRKQIWGEGEIVGVDKRAVDDDTHGCVLPKEGTVCRLRPDGNFSNSWELKPGVYNARFIRKTQQWSELFIVGDPVLLADQCYSVINAERQSKRSLMAIEPLQRRIDILLNRENRMSVGSEWQEKVAYTLHEMTTAIERVHRGEDPVSHITGLRLLGFESELDGSMQHFRIYIPPSYRKGTPIPLVVVPATTVAISRPFIASPFIANQAEALAMAEIAGAHGFAVVWPGYRKLPTGSPLEAAHLEEVLSIVQKNYDINGDRIAIVGVRNGARFGARAVASFPGKFSDITFIRGILEWEPYRSQYSNEAYSLAWRRLRDDWAALVDSTCPRLSWVGEKIEPAYQELLSRAKRQGKDVGFAETSGDFLSDWETALIGLSRSPPPPVRRSIVTNGIGVVPIENIWRSPVTVVEGAIGDPSEINAIRSFGLVFQARWGQRNFRALFRIVSDNQVAERELDRRSWILVGNRATNRLWSTFEDAIGRQTRRGATSVLGPVERGCYRQVITRNPFNRDHYVVFVGAPDISSVRFGDVDVDGLIEGLYSSATWDTVSASESRLAEWHLSDLEADAGAEGSGP